MIITNNPDAAEAKLLETEFVQGTPLDVLQRVSERLDGGIHLVTPPLSANNRLNRNPYRSIIMSSKVSWSGNEFDLFERGRNHLAQQGFVNDISADVDYRWIDLEHLRTAVEEAKAYKTL